MIEFDGPWAIWDYRNEKMANVIHLWRNSLEARQRAKFDQKVDMLRRSGPDLPPKLLAGTDSKFLKKLKITVESVELRPLLCEGPIDLRTEFTLLLGATERSWRWEPWNALSVAEQHRLKVISNPAQRRIPHEF